MKWPCAARLALFAVAVLIAACGGGAATPTANVTSKADGFQAVDTALGPDEGPDEGPDHAAASEDASDVGVDVGPAEPDALDAGTSDALQPDADTPADDAAADDSATTASDAAADGLADAGADSADAGPAKVFPPNCDAGDEAWVKRAVQALLGRKPTGMAEVDVLVAWVKAAGRATVADKLLTTTEAQRVGVQALLDSSRVARAGKFLNYNCYGAVLPDPVPLGLAAWLRDHGPAAVPPPAFAGATMGALAASALQLDDVSPWYRAQLFALLGRPAEFCQNVSAVDMDRIRRDWFGEKFLQLYTNRSLACVGCHNAVYSPTQTGNPATNHFFAVPGSFEKALFGSDFGHDEAEVYAPLRLAGVLSKQSIVEFPEKKVWPADPTTPVSPWGMHAACGKFLSQKNVLPVMDGPNGWLGGDLGANASIWDLEAKLHAGIDKLATENPNFDTAAIANDAERALAWLLATRVVDDAWSGVFGQRLVIQHGFPRSAQARDILTALSRQLVLGGWSRRALMVAIVTHPLFNVLAPDEGCGPAGPYSLTTLLHPFSDNEQDPAMQGNSPADGLHREEAFRLVDMAAHAAGWMPLPLMVTPLTADVVLDSVGFPIPYDLNEFSTRIGAFLDDSRPGAAEMDAAAFALWRSAVATCQPIMPNGTMLAIGAYDGYDWMAQLFSAATAKPLTVGDVVRAMRDRLIAEPDVPPSEVPSILALFGATAWNAPFVANEVGQAAARAYCGALLAAPQFWMVGLAAPDQQTRQTVDVTADVTLQDRCAAYQPLVAASGPWTLACGSGAPVVSSGP